MKSRRHVAIKVAKAHLGFVAHVRRLYKTFGVEYANNAIHRRGNCSWAKVCRKHEKRQVKFTRDAYGSKSVHVPARKSNRYGLHKFEMGMM